VYVPRGRAVELPLQTVTSIGTPDLGVFPRTLLVAEEQAEVVLVEEYFSSSPRLGQPVASVAVELFAGPGSRVRYVGVQQWAAPVWHFGTLRARQERDAAVTFLVAATGGRLTKQFVDAVMVGDGSEADLLGLMFGDANQHFDTYTLQDHVGSHTRSDLHIKVALRDRASSNFTGLVRVNAHATKTDANQENRNLLLSEHSKADSDPKLEILNSDILRCSHGATVGPVDQESLFYLMSRGLPRDQAEHVLVEGFFDPVLSRVPVESLRKQLWSTVRKKLEA
jgi:Fe-S cluster assembly protein SufD